MKSLKPHLRLVWWVLWHVLPIAIVFDIGVYCTALVAHHAHVIDAIFTGMAFWALMLSWARQAIQAFPD